MFEEITTISECEEKSQSKNGKFGLMKSPTIAIIQARSTLKTSRN